MKKILIIKTSALGDVVQTYPVISYLRQKIPSAQIDWVVEESFSDLVKSYQAVDNVLCLNTKSWRKKLFKSKTFQEINAFRKSLQKTTYDVVFDLQGNIKSGLILSQAKGRYKVGFGKATVPEWPNLFFSNCRYNPTKNKNIRHDYLSLVTSFFEEDPSNVADAVKLKSSEAQQTFLQTVINEIKQQGPVVLVCPGSAWRNKQLPTETLKAFLSLLNTDLKATYLFIWGSQEEKETAEYLHTAFIGKSRVVDKMSLSALQNLMGLSDLVIAMDSLPLHLAGTTKTPSFSLFGASSAAKYKPLGDHHYAFQGSCPYGKTFEKRCPILRTCSTGACIRDLQADQIYMAFKSWWNHLQHTQNKNLSG